jgi:pimeloyl-ACP methyl ester carboxylesterase
VLFVHGISGSPANWAPVIAHLDRSRFQPWFIYYPSGVSLGLVTDFLDRSIDALQARYGFRNLHVVAHSMGGLVARSFVMKHTRAGHSGAVTLFVTINSPMLGLASAATGVDLSPVVIPSWRDVARGSDFIERLYAQPWPAAIPYHLVFSYDSGEDGDGIVKLSSQIPVRLQDEGARLYGFKATHAGILGKAEFLRRFEKILGDTAAPRM